MFVLRQPGRDAINRFLSRQGGLPFSYAEVGGTRGAVPPGYDVDHNRVLLGTGEAVFERAISAVRSWQMFSLGWVRVFDPAAPIGVGTTVAVVGTFCGVHSVNACRIVYTIDEDADGLRRFGFAYGTLPAHVERGEERFTVEWHRGRDDAVWYDILAFSRPQHPLARLGYPIVRRLQRRFARDSKAAMVRAVGGRAQ